MILITYCKDYRVWGIHPHNYWFKDSVSKLGNNTNTENLQPSVMSESKLIVFSLIRLLLFKILLSPLLSPQVCKRMDLVCQRMLNQGFLKVERYHNLCQKQVKAQLPRCVTAAMAIIYNWGFCLFLDFFFSFKSQ